MSKKGVVKLSLIKFFVFSKFVPLPEKLYVILRDQRSKYLFWGSFNVLLSWALYFVSFHFITQKQNINVLGLVTISPHIFSLLFSFAITFFTGFFFNYFMVFHANGNHDLGKRLWRYFVSNMGSLVMNYLLLKVLVEILHFYPTPSQIICTAIITIYSFLMQKYFTFRRSNS
ncbi:GtrA family protein [Sphingobacterium psychroaquaticum]|uniref:GtrA-like protein n=1 Tax=Sphingobacterium psychroaquaticum TaxID=561061 RepID=A0A1X7LCL0_9SPHI|nr:GtrA family protein [Sphingobacterium psychroaquaticum]SMG51123.1 GtrA-like protein [Sphingobacterium psychroaquaticum]